MIEFRRDTLEEIRRHAREAYPEECCGALVGEIATDSVRVRRAEPLPNRRADQRERRYVISPEDYGRIERGADREGLVLLGFYHSHPDHPAVPSAYDREQALPFFHYLVMAVDNGEPGDIGSWILAEDRGVFEREELVSEKPGR